MADGKAYTDMELSMSPGQELFYSQSPLSKIELPLQQGGTASQFDFDARKVRPFFNSFPLTSAKPLLISQLNKHGYQLMNINKDRLESFTIVHLQAGREQLFASVLLAVDSNLKELPKTADPRLSNERRSIVEQILNASTLGEVLPGPYSLKMKFYALSQQVHVLYVII
jgi:hypothetical protein